MSAKNLYGHAWRKRRAAQLRDHPLCKFCLELRGRAVPATVADHVEPHRGDPVKFAGPIQSLCAQCHDMWKKAIEAGAPIKGCDLRGMPVDPRHPWNQEKSPGGEV